MWEARGVTMRAKIKVKPRYVLQARREDSYSQGSRSPAERRIISRPSGRRSINVGGAMVGRVIGENGGSEGRSEE